MTLSGALKILFAIAWIVLIPRIAKPLEDAYNKRLYADRQDAKRHFRVTYEE